MAGYGGDILVEHDVTQDLYRQVHERERSLKAWWDYVRWKRFEARAVRRFRRVVTMSGKDARLLQGAATTVIAHCGANPLRANYDRQLENGTKPNLAKLTLARRIAATVLSMWKNQEVYDPDRHRPVTDTTPALS